MARAAASSTAASPPTAGTDQLITAKKTPTLPSTRSIAHNAIPNNKRAGIGQAPGWLTAEISDAAPNRSEERRVGKECRSRCDWSSDVCSSDLEHKVHRPQRNSQQ